MARQRELAVGGEGREVIDAALHLIDEEMKISEFLERKAREQWQIGTFFAAPAISGALAVAALKDVPTTWYIVIGILGIIAALLLLTEVFMASAASDVYDTRGLNPDRLDAYVEDLNERHSFDEVRADLATTLAWIARERAKANDARRRRLKRMVFLTRLSAIAAFLLLVVAATAVLVNA